ncbi:hypothetical protein I4U23_012638 [Adineta vaga]|nr:hypothetical protein I4U23_012638 [Adineta vaga]
MISSEPLDERPSFDLEDLRRHRDKDEQYIIPPDHPKQTIILLGRSGVGKTTIVNVIDDSLYCPPISLLHHPTQKPQPHQIGGLRIIDTPDIFDQQNKLSKCKITNHNLLINQFSIPFIDNTVPLFGLVFSVHQGINADDITAMLNFKSKFTQLSPKMMLILTHCEEKLEHQRRDLINELFEHSRLMNSGMRDFFERGILFMGRIRRESLENNDRKALLFEHGHVMDMRNEFIRRCLEKDSFAVLSLNHRLRDLYHFYVQRFYNIITRMGWKCLVYLCPVISIVIYMYLRYRKGNIEITEIDKIMESPTPTPPMTSPPSKPIDMPSITYCRKGLWYGKSNENF